MKLAFVLLSLPLLAQQGAVAPSAEKERALGERLAIEIRRQSKPLASAAVQEYAARVGARLTAQLPDRPYDYTFEVILTADADEPIPLPGEIVLIPARFFLEARDEDEFAGMLSHAIAHVALRHGARREPPGSAGGDAIPLLFPGGFMGSHSDPRGAGPPLPAAFLKIAREREMEADVFGLGLAARAGYDASALPRYLGRGQAKDPTRLARIHGALAALPANTPSPGVEFQQVREIAAAAVRPPPRAAPTLRSPSR